MASIDDAGDPSLVEPLAGTPSGAIAERLGRSQTVIDLLVVIFWVATTDWLLYQSAGYAAWAIFFVLGALILTVGKRSCGARWLSLGVMLLLVACSLRLVWCGSEWSVISGIGLLCCYSMALSGLPPYLTDLIPYLVGVMLGAGPRVARFQWRTRSADRTAVESPLGWLLPAGLVLVFSTIFVRANPDLSQWVGEQWTAVSEHVGNWLVQIDVLEILFWIGSAWVGLGLVHPATVPLLQSSNHKEHTEAVPFAGYKAIRNSLLSVIVLFAIYLVFEFKTLWFREFPKGFYYAGYAHEGAAWLTAALALATLLLSLFFRGRTLLDPRVRRLRMLAWIWSAENFLLAIAVYHRLAIYIDFNGMTRMRVVGLFGITAVVVGFAWVIVKILQQRGFLWLVRYQLWTVACAVVLYAILPVDYFVHRYNASQILSGKLAPSVQIPTHETSAEGVLPLTALVDTEDAIIREGIRATLADWYVRLAASEAQAGDWRDFQLAHHQLRSRLEALRPAWQRYLQNTAKREQALRQFYDYTYQWY